MKEEWKNIAGYEGLYEVSNMGRVRSLNYNRRIGKIKVLKPQNNGQGYLVVKLSKNREGKRFKVHRLVAQTFIPNPFGKPQVNHKDENKTNNNVENLEWVTAKENNNYGTRTERAAKALINNPKLSKALINNPKLSKAVLQYTKDGKLIAEYPSSKEAARQTRINRGNISSCCRGKIKSAGGYVWDYK